MKNCGTWAPTREEKAGLGLDIREQPRQHEGFGDLEDRGQGEESQ